MWRRALLNSSRAAAQSSLRIRAPIAQRVVPSVTRRVQRDVPVACFQSIRCYSSGGGLSKEEVEGRILDLLKNFDKVTDASKLSPTSHFTNDLGLDSLDTVEVVMAIEEEFSIEIPDKEADAIHTVDKAVNYILSQPDGK
ncbi:acyl carrier protein [Rhizodiscina lignyota]|uniref:Acyl carrier protein n=1 Tax=Rhizodiscina lignyota TaxID=1504668 RepID=A0A9P4IPJ3_9PEZI|nr:acyl carrier protein [Rhizodiscina lignyota]